MFHWYYDFIARVVIAAVEEPHVIDLDVRAAEIPRINQNKDGIVTCTTHIYFCVCLVLVRSSSLPCCELTKHIIIRVFCRFGNL